MDVYVNNDPKGNKAITQTMIEDLIFDPVMACELLLGYQLDEFQKVRLRWYWWIPYLMDSSGFSTGKTIVNWIADQLRAMLFSGRQVGVFFPVFGQGKRTYWTYFSKCKSPIWRAQMGRTTLDSERKRKGSTTEAPDCWYAFYRNGSTVLMPAPSFAQDADTQGSLRLHDLTVDEWTKVEEMGEGLDQQLMGRATEPVFNQENPLWTNHIRLTAPARKRSHKGYKRFRKTMREVKRGNPNRHAISFCYKDTSRLPMPGRRGRTFRDVIVSNMVISQRRIDMDPDHFMADVLGIWPVSGTEWFPGESIDACVAKGVNMGLVPFLNRRQFLNHSFPHDEFIEDAAEKGGTDGF